ncbi:cysteine desulfurase SufS [soil metagenome]
MKDIKKDFPLLNTKINNRDLIYFDNAATSQKPQAVIDALSHYYAAQNSTIHRAVYAFGEQATTLYEKSRATVAAFINADVDEVVFTKGATESINAVANGWALENIKKDDEILLTQMEHHANLLPWQQIALKTGSILKFVPVRVDGTLDMSSLDQLITKKTKLVSCVHISNALGTLNDIKTITKKAHAAGARVLIDAAQSIAHVAIDVKKINCDFLAFSGHKMMGPTGIGVLYIKKDLHNQMQPYEFGGGMVYEVDFTHATWLKAPHKFEAGTPPIAQAIGLAAAVDYLKKHVPFEKLQKHEASLCAALIAGLQKNKKIRILGPIEQLKTHGHLVSFVVDGMHAHDVATFLSNQGICVRAGHHCAQPLAQVMNIQASLRASFYAYNTLEEVEKFLEVITLL